MEITLPPEPGLFADPDAWLEKHGDALFRYAMLQLRDATLAEDAVQETLLAALEARSRFSGKSSERTWLTGILKHKIIDLIRRSSRETGFENIDEQAASGLDDLTDTLFDERGEWVAAPHDWGNPETVLEQKRFREIFALCMKSLPPQLAMIFSLREISGMATEEICKDLAITSTNSWVMLYRARLGLRQCLEMRWLGDANRGDR